MSKKTNTLEDLWKELDKPETIWWKISCIPYRIREFVKDLYYNLHPKKLKRLWWFIRFNWKYYGYDYCYSLQLLKFGIDELIKDYQERNIYVGQQEDLHDIIIFRDCLGRLIEGDYGINDNEHYEDIELFGNNIKHIRKWWI